MVWTPINSPLFRFGDSYYYGAWVAEVIRNGLPPHSPSAAELAGTPLLETLRWLPLAVAAVPGIFISDFRIVYVLDYAFTATALFGIPFILSWTLLRNAWAGVFVGIIVLFCAGEWWTRLSVAPGFGAPNDPVQWFAQSLQIISQRAFTSFFNIGEYEADVGSFRYINNSISAPILLIYLYGCFAIYRGASGFWLIVLATAAASPPMAFLYPSRTFIAYALLLGFGGLAFVEGRKRAAVVFFAIGILTGLILISTGYIGYVQRVFSENELWNNIFGQERMVLADRPLGTMAMIALVNKYTVTFVASLALSWHNRDLRGLILVVGLIACGLACVLLLDTPQLWDRFHGRGIDQLWLTCFLLGFAAGWLRIADSLRARRWQLRLWQTASALLVVGVLLIPVRGFGDYALASSRNLTRFMPEGRWQALKWIDENVAAGTTVAALDWDDITFIPIYTHVKLAVDNMIVGGRSPADEMKRYAAVWKILGLDEGQLRQRIANSTQAAQRRRTQTPESLRSPPLVADPEAYASGQIAEALIYWPYVKKVQGLTVADVNSVVTNDFVEWGLSLYRTSDPVASVKDLGIEYVVLSGAERSLPVSFSVPTKLVFENATHRILRVEK